MARWLAVLLLLGCGSPSTPERPTPRPAEEAPDEDAPPRLARHREQIVLVNTPDRLFRLDPTTLEVTELGRFHTADGTPFALTDIAIDRRGRMWGVASNAVFRVDPRTCEVTRLADAPGRMLNSLAILTARMIGGGREDPDVLIAGDYFTGAVYQLDPVDGTQRQIGALGKGLGSSGDITWSPELGAVMIATDHASFEGITRMAPGSFEAEPIGRGFDFRKVRGLALVSGGLLGFSETGEIIAIDPRSGDATLRRNAPELMFYGAAVGWADTVL